MTLLEHALALHAAGLAVLPVTPNGSKAPAVNWKTFQHERPTIEQITTWFSPSADPWQPNQPAATASYDGLGVITGTVSGNLEMFEVEGRAVHLIEPLGQLLGEHGFTDLWIRLCNGYLEQTPSGGVHWHYRVTDGPAAPNTKLARRPMTDVELKTHQDHELEAAARIDSTGQRVMRMKKIDELTVTSIPQVMIETRGEGGFTVTAPSAGRTHKTGLPWQVLAGSPHTIPSITVDERDALHAITRMLDQMPAVDAPPRALAPVAADGSIPDGERPGDEYNAKTSWDDILVPHGWTRAKKLGKGYGWVRPGKDARDGLSATTGTAADGVDRLYVFSTSTEFDTETPYTKFAAYALLEHGGDYQAAARQLRKDGMGAPLPPLPERTLTLAPGPAPSTPPPSAAQDPGQAVDGATVHHLQPAPARTLAHSDDGNSQLLIDHHGDVLRHSADRGRWYHWDGVVWEPQPSTSGEARERAKEIARGLPERNEKDIAWKKKSLNAKGISDMLTQASTDKRVAVRHDQLDAHPWELNTPGGIVDLRTGQLKPPDPAKLHTRLTSCAPDPAADRTAWQRFLDTTFGGDEELIGYMQRLVGYSAVGTVGAHILPFCHGGGGNGKGTFLETCVAVLRDYATTAPPGFLVAKTHQKHETELARLWGARMVVCSENNKGDRFDEARVKLLTGGDSITAHFMHKDHFTFEPTHQLWYMANDQPGVAAGGHSFWRRLRLIPFLHQVSPEEDVDDFKGILASEHGPAILSWIIEGAVAYHQHGLREPAAVMVATGEYERDQDTVSRFLEEMCRVGGGQHVQSKVAVVRTAYEGWCREVGEQPVSVKAFTMALKSHGIEAARTRTARLYSNISLIATDAEPDSRPDPWNPPQLTLEEQ